MANQVKFTNKLEGNRILIVGGSAGVGYSVAEGCVELGAGAVIISSSSIDRVQDSVAHLRSSYPSKASRVSGFACNLAQEDVLEGNLVALLEAATSRGQHKLDHIAFTAGDTLVPTSLKNADLAYLKNIFLVRSFAPVLLTKLAVKYMVPGPSSSITFTSGASDFRPLAEFPLLGMMSGANRSVVRGLALELKPLRVNIAALGAVNTGLIKSIWDGKSQDEQDAMVKLFQGQTTTGRIAEPNDVAEAYIYCMKDHNITGSTIDTNGGHLLV